MSESVLVNSLGIAAYGVSAGSVLKQRKGHWVSFTFSFAVHMIALVAAGVVFVKPIEFSVDAGLSGVEIELVAGAEPQMAAQKTEDVQPVIEEVVPVVQEKDIIAEIKQEIVSEPLKEIRPVERKIQPERIAAPENSRAVNPGNSPVTAAAGSGARTQALPSYLSNPAPRYPVEARRNKWEGVVMLDVVVSKKGFPLDVDIQKSSGYPVLDDAAVKTVKTWRFRPSRIGNVPIETSVRIPVRFDLKQ